VSARLSRSSGFDQGRLPPRPRDLKGGTMTDDSYPSSWRPAGAPPFNEPEPEPAVEPLAMEVAAAAMTDDEWQAFVQRARGGRS
jgi:hypothetical protein